MQLHCISILDFDFKFSPVWCCNLLYPSTLFGWVTIFCSLKPGVNPRFSSYQTMVTSHAPAIDRLRQSRKIFGLSGRDVINLVLYCLIWRDQYPPSVWSLLEKGVRNLKYVQFSKLLLAYHLSCFCVPIPWWPCACFPDFTRTYLSIEVSSITIL